MRIRDTENVHTVKFKKGNKFFVLFFIGILEMPEKYYKIEKMKRMLTIVVRVAGAAHFLHFLPEL